MFASGVDMKKIREYALNGLCAWRVEDGDAGTPTDLLSNSSGRFWLYGAGPASLKDTPPQAWTKKKKKLSSYRVCLPTSWRRNLNGISSDHSCLRRLFLFTSEKKKRDLSYSLRF